MKVFIQRGLQIILGFETYLFVFSWFKIFTIKFDKGEKDFFYFLKLIPAHSNVLDLGANIGIMTYHLSHTIGNGKVIAFEPIPWNFKTLKKIVRLRSLKNVILNQLALGNNFEPLKMVVPVVNGVKKQGLSHVIASDITEFNEGIIVEVEQTTIDTYLIKHPIAISAIKIDVENFEYQVFKGSQNLIKTQNPLVYCELWDNQNRKDCFSFFTDLNYQIMVVHQQKLVKFAVDKHKTQNFIFIPQSFNHA